MAMRKVGIKELVAEHLGVLNKLESHLGCAQCRGPLTDGRCPKCQPEAGTKPKEE